MTTRYSGHYDPQRNPNSAMLRVLSTIGADPVRGPSMESGGVGDPDFIVRVGVGRLGSALLHEAQRAGFRFVRCVPQDDGTVNVDFDYTEAGE